MQTPSRHLLQIALLCAALCPLAHATELPASVTKQIPAGHTMLRFQAGQLNDDKRLDYLVVVHKPNEEALFKRTGTAPRRPLLVFIQMPDQTYVLAVRNDEVVYAIDAGGQCDPFLDSGDGLSIKNGFFTIENGVACGEHWTDYHTFKYMPALKTWVFRKRVFENWVMNTSTRPDAEALVLGKRKVTTGDAGKPVLLRDYRPE